MKLLMIYFIINTVLYIISTTVAYFDENFNVRSIIKGTDKMFDTKLKRIGVMTIGLLIGMATELIQHIIVIIFFIIIKLKNL